MKKPSSINKGPWLLVRAELTADPTVSLLILAQPRHTFHDLHETIEMGSNRPDQGHLHRFDFAEAEPVGNDTMNLPPEQQSSEVVIGDRVDAGDRFTYLFDFGDNWLYDIGIERTNLGLGTAFRTFEEPFTMAWPLLLAASGPPPEQCPQA